MMFVHGFIMGMLVGMVILICTSLFLKYAEKKAKQELKEMQK